MVLEGDIRHDDTMQSLSPHETDMRQNASMRSYQRNESQCDASYSQRECRDDTREAFQASFQNSQSILNCTSDGEESDDSDAGEEEAVSFMFDEEDFHSPLNQSLDHDHDQAVFFIAPTSSPPSTRTELCCDRPANGWLETSLQNVTESFVSLCSVEPDVSCGFGSFVDATEKYGEQLRHQVEFDLLQLLGCDESDNFDVFWVLPMMRGSTLVPCATRSTPPRKNHPHEPLRLSLRQRAERIRRMRQELLGHDAAQFLNNPTPLVLTRSMDEQRLSSSVELENWGIDPIEPATDGYDSDPGEVLSEKGHTSQVLRNTPLLEDDDEEQEEADNEDYHFYDGHREVVAEHYKQKTQVNHPHNKCDRGACESVQVRLRIVASLCFIESLTNLNHIISVSLQHSLNVTWPLTLHVAGNPMPVCIHFWIERGSLLQFGAKVVEPKFMWRQVHQPSGSRILNESSCKPTYLRVLNVCRIVEATSGIDRTKYPMARVACSLFLKTCKNEVYLFEAPSPRERDAILYEWKLVVARLASLAVLEDMEAMAKEFFTPIASRPMLMTDM